MLDLVGLGEFMEAHYQRSGDVAFRMERLPMYSVESDGDDYARWKAGATEPTWSRKQPVLDQLASDQAEGLLLQRVRVFARPRLTDYELYECHFGYAYNALYEDIRVIHAGEHTLPAEAIERDYWLVIPFRGRGFVLPMRYDEEGRFVGADVIGDPAEVDRYMVDRARALAVAEPFTSWWARHGELHRHTAAA